MAIRAISRPTTSDPTPLQAVADRYQSRFASAILAAVNRVRASISAAQIEREGFQAEPDWSRFWLLTKAEPSYEPTYLEALLAGAKEESKVRFAAALSLVNQRAVEAAQQRAAQLVVQISRESQTAIRDVLAQSLAGRLDTKTTARLIRDAVGLDSQRAVALVNYRAALEGVRSGELAPSDAARALADQRFRLTNLNALKVDQMASRYAENALKARATTIARTETIRAAHDGQRALWDQASEMGLFDRSEARQVWVTTESDRTCEECSALDGEAIGFDDSFASGSFIAEYPPLHPQCRCDLSLDI